MNAGGADHLLVTAGPRVRVRRKRPEDALDEFQWRRDPEIARYDGTAPTDDPYSNFYARFEEDMLGLDPQRRGFAIETPEGLHIGTIVHYNLDTGHQSAELGVTIADPAHRGGGLGTEAVVTFLRFTWETMPFRLVYLHTLEWNERAIRCFQRAGFTGTARVQRRGHWFLRMEARREWWLMWDMEGRFGAVSSAPRDADAAKAPGR